MLSPVFCFRLLSNGDDNSIYGFSFFRLLQKRIQPQNAELCAAFRRSCCSDVKPFNLRTPLTFSILSSILLRSSFDTFSIIVRKLANKYRTRDEPERKRRRSRDLPGALKAA